jgi:hypothetical protein
MSKIDLDAAYCRVHPIWSLAIQCIVVIANLAYLLLRLPFGAAAAPSEFCIASEICCEIANSLLQDPSWDAASTTTPFHQLLPPQSTPSTSSPFMQALPLDIQYPPMRHDYISDVYIDDFITVGLALPHLLPIHGLD